ncbi:MAG: hypothetical protein LUC93_18280 [Planctomycetaceae bacterium]|nr:hypothetical protein [Planctomycetaceae bacterium]
MNEIYKALGVAIGGMISGLSDDKKNEPGPVTPAPAQPCRFDFERGRISESLRRALYQARSRLEQVSAESARNTHDERLDHLEKACHANTALIEVLVERIELMHIDISEIKNLMVRIVDAMNNRSGGAK